MAFKIVSLRRGFHELCIEGILALEDVHKIREHSVFPASERPGAILLDLMGVTAMDVGINEIGFAANFADDERLPPKIAILVGNDVALGTTMQFVHAQGVEHRVAPFLDRQRALAWLASAGTATEP